MIREVIDPNSGAILFKKSKDAKKLDKALKEIEELKKKVSELESIVEKLKA